MCVCVLRVLRDREQLTGHLRVLAAFTLLLLINISHNSERGEWEERESEGRERGVDLVKASKRTGSETRRQKELCTKRCGNNININSRNYYKI